MRTIAAIVAAAVSASGGMAQQLLENGGFETGDLPPWVADGWFVTAERPWQGHYCAACPDSGWVRQDFAPVRAWRVGCVWFGARHSAGSAEIACDFIFTDSSLQRQSAMVDTNWNLVLWTDTALPVEKRVCGLRFWSWAGSSEPAETTYLDGVDAWLSDVGVSAWLSPVGGETLNQGRPVSFVVKVRNYDAVSVHFWTYLMVHHISRPYSYAESVWVQRLSPGGETTVVVDTWTPMHVGWHGIRVTVNPDDSVGEPTYFYVAESVGVNELPRVPPLAPGRAASLVRGCLFLAGRAGAMLFDAEGRQVAALKPGANDVHLLAPGVYFVYSEPSAVQRPTWASSHRQPSAVQKVVVTR